MLPLTLRPRIQNKYTLSPALVQSPLPGALFLKLQLLGFFVESALAAPAAILLKLYFALNELPIFAGMVIDALAGLALHSY